MKLSDQSWREVLLEGVEYMEGTHPRQPGRRSFPKAKEIFDACEDQREDLSVRVEGIYRLAQLAYYQNRREEALKHVDHGELVRNGIGLSGEVEAQCLLLKGVVTGGWGKKENALDSLRIAFSLAPEGAHKLRGDIANRLGRIYAELGRSFHSPHGRRAVDWFERAVQEFQRIREKSATDLHALAAASGRAGVAIERYFGLSTSDSRAHFQRAENLFLSSVRDPCVRAAYWLNRSRSALICFYRLKALWFFLRCLPPGLRCWWQKRARS